MTGSEAAEKSQPDVQSGDAISVSQVAESTRMPIPELNPWRGKRRGGKPRKTPKASRPRKRREDGMSEPTQLPPVSTPFPAQGERRKFPRFAANRAISGSLITHDRIIWAREIVDVSAGGIGLVLDYRADPGSALLLDLYLPRRLPRILRIRVAHSREGPEGRFFVGGAFGRELGEDEVEELR